MRAIVACGALVFFMLGPAQTYAQERTTVQDIEDYGQRYLNRLVEVEGQVLEVQAEPRGTSRGWYSIGDQTAEYAVSVWTPSLPAPGDVVRVTGEVQQHPRNARQLIISEDDRCMVGALLGCGSQWLVFLAGLISIGLVGYLIYLLARGGGSKRTPRSTSRPPVYEGPTLEFTDVPRPSGTSARARAGDVGGAKVTKEFHNWGARLSVVEGPDTGKSVPIGVSPFLMGRAGGRENHFSLSDPTVSRSHAQIMYNPASDSFSILNESERNPIEVDGRKINATEMQQGSRIRMGATTMEFTRSV